MIERKLPDVAPFGRDATGAGANDRTALRRIDRVEHHKPGIVGLTIGILKSAAVAPLQWGAQRIAAQIDRAGRGQDFAPAEVVIDEQARAQQPWRAQAGRRRQHEPHRPDEMRGHAQHDLAFDERLPHQAKPAMLEIAQSAVNELGGSRRRPAGQVALLDQQHAKPAAGGITCDPGAVDAAADYGEIEVGHARLLIRRAEHDAGCRPNSSGG